MIVVTLLMLVAVLFNCKSFVWCRLPSLTMARDYALGKNRLNIALPFEPGFIGGDLKKAKEGTKHKPLTFEVTPSSMRPPKRPHSSTETVNQCPKLQLNSLPFPTCTGEFPKRVRRTGAELRQMAANIKFIAVPCRRFNEMEI